MPIERTDIPFNPGSVQDALFAAPNSTALVTWDYNLNTDGGLRGSTGNTECGKTTATPVCGGLGATGGTPNPDALNGNSAGIDQALIFSFSRGIVPSNTISVDLRGFDTGDAITIYVEFSPSNGSPSDVSATPSAVNGGTQTISFASLSSALNVTTPVSKVAIYVASGAVGVGRVAYTQTSTVPEPATWHFVVFAASLAGWRRWSANHQR